ncbi:restriction endonuclease [Opitutaceae bacterium TAV1]|nr:restriction endonuclease [Opitutaceae bacterium TAV1]
MPIPTYDKLFRPVLALAAREPITRHTANAGMIRQFRIAPEEVEQRLASGQSTILNRTGWAMTFLTKAGLIEKVAPKTYRATEKGRAFLTTHPETITNADLNAIPGYKEAWENASARRRERVSGQNVAGGKGSDGDQPGDSTSTPDEIIEREINKLRAALRKRLLKAVLDQTPEFFEGLVLDVLVKMGYGGSREAMAAHLGRPGDEGIDGCINQDALGLDQIMVQAKRYGEDNIVGRPAVQGFVGSLAGQGVSKGVFITTSDFSKEAREFVQRGLSTKVVLVDGEKLLDLMIEHGIGVHVARTHKVHDLDQNYFEEDE